MISLLDRSNKKLEDDVSLESIANDFGIYDIGYGVENTRLKSYWLRVWYCTDSYVGWKAYYLDDELVCVSSQLGRKCDEVFEYVSTQTATKVRDYLLTLVCPREISVDIINQDEEYHDNYYVEYSSQIMNTFHKFGKYKPTGDVVEIVKTYNDYIHFHEVNVKFPDGSIKEVDCRDILFEYCKTY